MRESDLSDLFLVVMFVGVKTKVHLFAYVLLLIVID